MLIINYHEISAAGAPRHRYAMPRAVFEDIEQIRARSPELFSDSQSVPVRRNVVVWQ